LAGGETFIPQSYRWGQEAQVDWYEAWAELGGERQKLYVFCMRSMASVLSQISLYSWTGLPYTETCSVRQPR